MSRAVKIMVTLCIAYVVLLVVLLTRVTLESDTLRPYIHPSTASTAKDIHQ